MIVTAFTSVKPNIGSPRDYRLRRPRCAGDLHGGNPPRRSLREEERHDGACQHADERHPEDVLDPVVLRDRSANRRSNTAAEDLARSHHHSNRRHTDRPAPLCGDGPCDQGHVPARTLIQGIDDEERPGSARLWARTTGRRGSQEPESPRRRPTRRKPGTALPRNPPTPAPTPQIQSAEASASGSR